MVSRRVHCAFCQKKCSGNVLRYQDRYYHKQCFELEQSESLTDVARESPLDSGRRPELRVDSATSLSDDVSLGRASCEPNEGQQDQSKRRTPAPSTRVSATHSPADKENVAPADSRMSNTGPTLTDAYTSSGHARKQASGQRAATLPHSISSPASGFQATQQRPYRAAERGSHTLDNRAPSTGLQSSACAGCREKIVDGQALIALDRHWHVWCFKCARCRAPLHGEYVAKDGLAYCEKDYQKLFGIACVYCKRYITGKVLQAGEAHHFHPSCARCSKCGDPFVPGEEMYLQGEVTWHPRCGPGPSGAESSLMDGESGDRQSSQLRAHRAESPSLSAGSRSRSASPFSFMSRQLGQASPAYADSEAVGDLSRIYTISYLNADPNQGYLRRPLEPNPPKSPQFSRPTSLSRLGGAGSRCSSRSQQRVYSSTSGLGGSQRERSMPRGMYSVLSGMRSGSSSRARSPSMMNEEAIQLAAYPSGQKPAPNSLAKIERDDFPAPPFPYPDRPSHTSSSGGGGGGGSQRRSEHTNRGSPVEERTTEHRHQRQERASRPRSRDISSVGAPGNRRPAANGAGAEGGDRELALEVEEEKGPVENDELDLESSSSAELDPQFRKEEEELSKIASGIGKIFLQTLKERERLRAWKRANLDPRNASRTPSATRELPSRLRYDNPTNASPSRDMDRPRPWGENEPAPPEPQSGEQSPTRTRSSLGRPPGSTGGAPSALSSAYGYKVVQSSRWTPRPGYGVTSGPYAQVNGLPASKQQAELPFAEQQRVAQARAADLLGRQTPATTSAGSRLPNLTAAGSTRSLLAGSAHLRRSMPNVANLQHLHLEGPPKLYPYHLLATSNYRLPPDVDRCHLERHLSNEEFQYIFHCDRIHFYRLPEWKRNELKRRARLF